MRHLLLLLIVTAGLVSCEKEISSKVDQDKIWANYELVYNKSEDATLARATFHFSSINGTKLKLSEPSYVTVDGNEMPWDSDNGYYESSFSGLKSDATFYWEDIDGLGFTNSIEVHDIAFPATINELHYSDSVSYFAWDGLAVDSSETIGLTIDGSGSTDARIFSVSEFGATQITIDSITLSQIDSGMVSLVLNRRFRPELLEGTTRGGQITGRYLTDTMQVLLTN